MKSAGRRTLFVVMATMIMIAVPFSIIDFGSYPSDAGITVIVPEAKDYGYRLTTSAVTIDGVHGETLTGVEYWDKDKVHYSPYEDTNYKNLLYETNQGRISQVTTDLNPNLNSYFSFDNVTGIGPFNSFYAAVNIGNTQTNGGEHKLSSQSGRIAYILNPDNLKQAIISTDTPNGAYSGKTTDVGYYDIPADDLADYNIMLYIPTVYWHSDSTHLWLSNKPDFFEGIDDGADPSLMEARAHIVNGVVKPYLALAVYEGYVTDDGKLVSQSGKNPTTYKSIGQLRVSANNLNADVQGGQYMVWNFYQWTLYKMMAYTVIGTKNSQLAIGDGVTRSSTASLRVTGQGDDQGAYWGGVKFNGNSYTGTYANGRSPVKLFLENTWGSLHDLVDDAWLFDGQLHAGHNDSQYLIDNTNSNASYRDGTTMKTGSDEGLNDNQQLIGNAVIKAKDGSMNAIWTTYANPEYWDFPATFGGGTAYNGIGDSVQFSTGNQTICVGGHYDAQDKGGLNRINVRNSFGIGKLDIGTRLAFLVDGGTVSYSGDTFEITTDRGVVSSGLPVMKGVDITISKTTGDDVAAVYVNGEPIDGSSGTFKFEMRNEDVHLEVIQGRHILMPTPVSYTYDGQMHQGIYATECYTIEGDNRMKDAGTYDIYVTPVNPYTWTDGSNTTAHLTWTIEKRSLLIEGSSSAEISKEYDGTKNLVQTESCTIQKEDLFIHGLADGEIPNLVYTATFKDASAGVNKIIDVTSLTLNESETFDPDNYEYTFVQFVITGTNVVITAIGLDSNSVVIAAVADAVYNGSEITPTPRVTINGNTLQNNRDYVYNYKNNINAGTATVIVQGINNYSSSKSTTFVINKMEIEWPAFVEKAYNGEIQTAVPAESDYYTVVTAASGKDIGDYDMTLRLTDPDNTKWTDTNNATKTAKGMQINDVSNILNLDATPGTWIPEYVPPTRYTSSAGITLPRGDKVSPKTEHGYIWSFEGWYVAGDETHTLVTEIPAGSVGTVSLVALYSSVPEVYTVSFEMQGHGVQVDDQDVEYLDKAVRPDDPACTEYDFVGWYKDALYSEEWDFDSDMVEQDTSIFAKWSIKTFTVTWKNGDTVLQTDEGVSYGTTPVYRGNTPVKQETYQYTYTFDSWVSNDPDAPAVSPATKDVIYTATFESHVISYTVHFSLDDQYIENLTVFNDSYTVAYGTTFRFQVELTAPYSKSIGNITVVKTVRLQDSPVSRMQGETDKFEFEVTGETYITIGGMTLNEYTAVWNYVTAVDENGNFTWAEYSDSHVRHNNRPPAPTIPASVSNTQYTWTFSSWDPAVNAITDDAEYTAQYERTVNQYELRVPTTSERYVVTLSDITGQSPVPMVPGANILVDYGTNYELTFTMTDAFNMSTPELRMNGVTMNPTEPGGHTYHFTVTGETDIEPYGTITINMYDVTWKAYDGTALSTTRLPYDAVPSPPEAPVRASTHQYHYDFDKWDADLDNVTVTTPVRADVVYTATYDEVLNQYTVHLPVSPNGTFVFTAITEGYVDYGTTFQFKMNMGAGYTDCLDAIELTGRVWGESFTIDRTSTDGTYNYYSVVVNGDIEIVSVDNISFNTYQVRWTYMDTYGHSVTSDPVTVTHGQTPAVPNTIPASVSNAEYTKTRTGFTPAVGPATGDVTFVATYSDPARNNYALSVPVDTEQFTITLVDVTGGGSTTIVDRENLSVPYGNEYNITITMAAAYSNSHPVLVSQQTDVTLVSGSTYHFTVTGFTEVGVAGQIARNQYTVTWYNWFEGEPTDGDIVAVHTVAHGNLPAPPADPTRSPDVQYSYMFNEWKAITPNFDLDTPVTQNIAFMATYGSILNNYNVSARISNNEPPVHIFSELNANDEVVHVFEGDNGTVSRQYGSTFKFKLHLGEHYTQSMAQAQVYATHGATKTLLVSTGTLNGDNVYEFEVAGDTSITVENITLNTYRVTWNYEDTYGHASSTYSDIRYGQMARTPNGIPATLSNAQYTKTLTGWLSDTEPAHGLAVVTGNITYIAQYSAPTVNTYTLAVPDSSPPTLTIALYRLVDEQYVPVDISGSMTFPYGTQFRVVVDMGDAFDKTMISFADNGVAIAPLEQGGKTYEFTLTEDKNITIAGNPTRNSYQVRWYSESTLLYTESSVIYGAEPAYPGLSLPTKDSTASLVYTFNKWVIKGTVDDLPDTITADYDFEATYTSAPRTYHITLPTSEHYTIAPKTGSSVDTPWNEDFIFIFTSASNIEAFDFYLDGVAIDRPTLIEGSYQYTIENVTADKTLSVVDHSQTTFDVIWKNGETILYSQKVTYGDRSAYPGQTDPTKDSDTEHVYSFTGWSKDSDEKPDVGEAVTANVIYTAMFSSSARHYTVSFQGSASNAYTFTPLNPTSVAYDGTFRFTLQMGEMYTQCIGTVEVIPKINDVPGEALVHTSLENGVRSFSITVQSDVLITISGIRPNSYTVTWNYKVDATTDDSTTTTVYHGAPAQAPGNIPQTITSVDTVWTFTGWDPAPGTITGPGVVYNAVYEETDRLCSVSVPGYNPRFTINLWEKMGDELEVVNERTFSAAYNSQYRVQIVMDAAFDQHPPVLKKNGADMTLVAENTYDFTVLGDSNIGLSGQLTINTYTVTWIVNDTQTVTEEHVEYGATPAYPNTIRPNYPSTQQYSYTFNEWEPVTEGVSITTPVTQDVTYRATYTPVLNQYTVSLQSSDDFTLAHEGPLTVDYGTEFTIQLTLSAKFTQSLNAARLSATVNGVTEDMEDTGTISGSVKTFTFTVEEDVFISVNHLSPNTYSVTWQYRVGDTTVVTTEPESYVYNRPPQPPTIENAVTDGAVTYTFTGWDHALSPITADTDFVACYDEVPAQHRMTLIDDAEPFYLELYRIADGQDPEQIDISTERSFLVDYGSEYHIKLVLTAAYNNSTPFLVGQGRLPLVQDTTDTYRFVMGTSDVHIDVGGMIRKNVYVLTWNNYDGTEISSREVEHGAIPSYTSAAPTKASTVQYSYVHDGWTSSITGETYETPTAPVTANTTYTAHFNQVVNQYTVSFQNSEDFILTPVGNPTVDYNSTLTFTLQITNSRYTQSITSATAWKTQGGETTQLAAGTVSQGVKTFQMQVTGNALITIQNLRINTYQITWVYLDGDLQETSTTTTAIHGPVPAPPNFDTVVENESTRKTFTSWSPTLQSATENTTYTAQYDTEAVEYDVSRPMSTGQFTVTLNKKVGEVLTPENRPSFSAAYGTRYVITVEMAAPFSNSAISIKINDVEKTNQTVGSVSYEFVVTEDTAVGIGGRIGINMYDVTWVSEGNVIKIQTVGHGTTARYPDSDPTKAPTDANVYTFTSWTSDSQAVAYGGPITEDVTFTANFESSARPYTVLWRDYDGTVLHTATVNYGVLPDEPDDPVRDEDAVNRYAFNHWTPEVAAVSGDVSYTAVYTATPLKVTITWKNYNGAILRVDTNFPTGNTPSYEGAIPVRPADAQYTYTFDSWLPALDGVDRDMEYTAQYSGVLNQYTIRWADENGVLLDTSTVDYGQMPAYPGQTNPTKEADVQYTYTFRGWSPDLTEVTGETTYFAVYDATVNKYDVTWVSYDGSVLKVDKIEYGSTPVYSGVSPMKIQPAHYKHTWVGWDRAIVPVEGDATYTAVFEQSIYDVTVTVRATELPDLDHGTVENAGTVTVDSNSVLRVSENTLTIEGTAYTFTAIPNEVEGQYNVFISWYVGDNVVSDGDMLSQDITVIEARFASIPAGASLSISTYIGSEGMGNFTVDANPELPYLSVSDIDVGSMIELDNENNIHVDGHVIAAVPLELRSANISFDGWTYMATGTEVHTGDRITSLTAIGARFTLVADDVTVTWKDHDGTILREDTVPYGSMPEYGAIPVRQAETINDVEHVYIFTSWSVEGIPTEISSATADIEYTACYRDFTDTVLITVDLNGGSSEVVTENNGWYYDPTTRMYYKEYAKSDDPLDLGTATKEEGLHYTYEFNIWVGPTGQETVPNTAAFAHYRADFTEVAKQYTVTFNANGGTVSGNSTKTLVYNQQFGNLPGAYWTDYAFLGWYTDPSEGACITSSTVFTEAYDMTLYAHWEYVEPEPEPIPPEPTHTEETEVIVNPDGSVTTITTETTQNPDGSSIHKVTETTENTDGTKTENVIQQDTDANGNVTTTTTEKHTAADGTYNSEETTELPDGAKVIVDYKGDSQSETISSDVQVDVGEAPRVSDDVAGVINEKISEVVETEQDPHIVIISENSTAIPKSVIDNVIAGNGSLTYIENENELYFTAETLNGIGLPDVESMLSIIQVDTPEEYKDVLPENTKVFEIRMTVDDTEYHELFVSPVKVTIKYPLSEQQNPANIQVFYLGTEGQEKMDFEYIDGFVVFYIPHMSLYSVEYIEDAPIADESDYTFIIIAAGCILVVLCAAWIVYAGKH
ncbi:TIGR02543 family repeat-containing cell surface protein [methanogenic archaeon mixed culture ISO4-G1]|nr:TIGR02543 family repeat-containing cell surface protein [methanogenic archaeon mixed culture ISO4-G1]